MRVNLSVCACVGVWAYLYPCEGVSVCVREFAFTEGTF